VGITPWVLDAIGAVVDWEEGKSAAIEFLFSINSALPMAEDINKSLRFIGLILTIFMDTRVRGYDETHKC
jgi:hypothetical protein